jgi:hypothetical protein
MHFWHPIFLDLFKEVEGISYAYGMGASCEVAPISTL